MCYFDCGREPIGTIASGDYGDRSQPFASVAVCGDRACLLKAHAYLYEKTRIEPGRLVTFEEYRRMRDARA
jgi:hypothetical protein